MTELELKDGRKIVVLDMDEEGVIIGRIERPEDRVVTPGDMLMVFRKKCGVTQTTMAERTGISQTTISRFEKNKPTRAGNDAVLSALSAAHILSSDKCKQVLSLVESRDLLGAVHEIAKSREESLTRQTASQQS